MQNGFVEALIGRLRDECPNEHVFRSLPAAIAFANRSKPDHNPIGLRL